MFKKLLVAVDGSPTAQAALQCAVDMAGAFGAAVTVVTVYDPYPFLVSGVDYGAAQLQYAEAARAEADTLVKNARALVAAAGLAAEGQVIESNKTWRGILDTAQSSQADLIVMGSHGRSGLDKLVMGSVAQRVLQHSTLPVLVVRAAA